MTVKFYDTRRYNFTPITLSSQFFVADNINLNGLLCELKTNGRSN